MTPIYADLKKWSELTSMNRSAIFTALKKNQLPAIKVGRRVLIEVEPGLAWLASQKIERQSTAKQEAAA